MALVQCKLLCAGFKDLTCHHAYYLFMTPHSIGYLKSNGRHTHSVDATGLKIADGQVASTDTTAVPNFMQMAVFKGHNY